MNVLFVAPQPFFTNRGTPIAVRLMTEALGSMGHHVDLLTYHLGSDLEMGNVSIHRIPDFPIRKVSTGFSLGKLVLDMPLSMKFLRMATRGKYDLIHCVEESVFIALFTQPLHRRPFVFDVDSSMPDQLSRKGRLWRDLNSFFTLMENWAIRRSLCCITVCSSLSKNVLKVDPGKKVFQIEDIPIVPGKRMSRAEVEEKRLELGIGDGKLCAYMGNFSRYQGIDLMFSAFRKVKGRIRKARLMVIGGSTGEVRQQEGRAHELGILDDITFTGRKPPEESADLLQIADVLLSPRVHGTNTPMKIYTYMASGVPIVATNLLTHTQVLDDTSAVLVAAGPDEMAEGIVRLLENDELGRRLAAAAAKVVQENYSRKRYVEKLRDAYDWIENRIA